MTDQPTDLINDLRRRIVKGETVSDEELREAIAALHQFRDATVPAVAKKKVDKASKKSAKMSKAESLDFLKDLL